MVANGSDSDFKFAVGFILGIMAGLTVSLLLAPQSGDKTRKLIKEKVADAGAMVKDIADDISGIAKEVAGDRKKIYAETWKQPKAKPYAEDL